MTASEAEEETRKELHLLVLLEDEEEDPADGATTQVVRTGGRIAKTGDGESTRSQASPSSMARDLGRKVGLDVENLLEHMEAVMLAQARARHCRAVGDVNGFDRYAKEFQALHQDLVQDRKQFLIASSPPTVVHSSSSSSTAAASCVDEKDALRALQLLQNHVATLRRRMKEELGYEVGDDVGAEQSLTKARRRARRRAWQETVGYVAPRAAAVAAVVAGGFVAFARRS